MSIVLQNDIKAIVRANTTEEEPQIVVVENLERYIKNPTTVDIVYIKILERVENDTTRNPLVLSKCLRLLKRYLVYHVPSLPVVETLNQFCLSVATTDIKNQKTISYIRALLNRTSLRKKEHFATKIKRTVNSSTKRHLLVGSTWTGKEKLPVSQEVNSNNSQKNWIIPNYLNWKLSQKQEPFLNTRARSLLYHPIFVCFVDKEKFQPIDITKESYFIEEQRLQERITTVRNAKKQDDIEREKEVGIIGVKKSIQLFQFKYYSEQQKLLLSKEELEQVKNGVIRPPSSNSYESRLIASKILIKILVDRFINDQEESATEYLMDILSEMLKSPEIETQIHSFNLLFNLSVHFNLWDDLTSQSPQGKEEINKVKAAQNKLLDILQEMLKILLFREESSSAGAGNNKGQMDRIWSAAYNCLLFWITKDGRLDKLKLAKTLDIICIPSFIKYLSNYGDITHRHLIRMLINCLYYSPPPSSSSSPSVPSLPPPEHLNPQTLKKIGGINYIIDLYITTRSSEAKENLFYIIYDFIIHSKNLKGNAEKNLEVLKNISAPILFTQLFKFHHVKISDFICDFIFPPGSGALFDSEAPIPLSSMPNSSTGSFSLSQNLSDSFFFDHEKMLEFRKSFKKLAQAFESLSKKYLSLSGEFKEMYESSMQSEDLSALNSFLKSNRADNRRYAELWLFQLLVDLWYLKKPFSQSLAYQIDKLYSNLLDNDSSRPETLHSSYQIFISIFERMLLFLQFQAFTATTEELRVASINQIIGMLNEQSLKILKKEDMPEELSRKIFDIIWSFLIYPSGVVYDSNTTGDIVANDSFYTYHLKGAALLPASIIQGLDIHVFSLLFDKLTNKNYAEFRQAILLVLIEKCKNSKNLELIGGIPFFRKLLASRDSVIAYHASRFLVDQLETEKPSEYKAIVSVLLNKAQQTNNDRLLSNTYLQIKALIGDLQPNNSQ